MINTGPTQTEANVAQRSASLGTYPSPGDSTSAGAAAWQTQPPRSACAGRSLRRASRNNCTTSCTGGKSAKPCSSPGRKKGRCSVEDTSEALAVNEGQASSLGWQGQFLQLANLCLHVSTRVRKPNRSPVQKCSFPIIFWGLMLSMQGRFLQCNFKFRG